MDGDVGLEEQALYLPIENVSVILEDFIANDEKKILISDDKSSFWTAVARNTYVGALNTGIIVTRIWLGFE